MTPAYPAQRIYWMLNSLNKKIAIIGVGNTLRRDDGVGIAVLESLKNSDFRKKAQADLLSFGISCIDLLHRIRSYKSVLLIDGINAGLKAGELKIFDLGEAEYGLKGSFSSAHELSLRDLFALAKKLGVKTKIFVAGIQVEDTSYQEGLSEGLESKKGAIIDEIREFIDRDL